jgi:hypothetical protein
MSNTTLVQQGIDGHDEAIYKLMSKHAKQFPDSRRNKCWSGHPSVLRNYLTSLQKEIDNA